MIPKYYEYSNRTKTMAGLMALDNLPYELKERGAKRPMIIAQKSGKVKRGYKALTKALSGTDLRIGSLYLVDDSTTSENHLLNVFDTGNCDAIIALGDSGAFRLGKRLKDLLIREGDEERLLLGTEYARRGHSIPFVLVPMANSGTDISGEPELVVLDPRMTMDLSLKEIFLWGVDTLAHGIEAYTCLKKNPLSDGYAYSAINLVRENLPRAMRCRRDKKARYGLAQAALMAGLASMNTQAGLSHLLAQALEECCGIPAKEALVILLPYYMDTYLTRLDTYYGELLLPLAGPEIYADTLNHERGRKTVQVLRSLIDQYQDKYNGPLCLSAAGVARSDFDPVIGNCIKNAGALCIPEETLREDLCNILSKAY